MQRQQHVENTSLPQNIRILAIRLTNLHRFTIKYSALIWLDTIFGSLMFRGGLARSRCTLHWLHFILNQGHREVTRSRTGIESLILIGCYYDLSLFHDAESLRLNNLKSSCSVCSNPRNTREICEVCSMQFSPSPKFSYGQSLQPLCYFRVQTIRKSN